MEGTETQATQNTLLFTGRAANCRSCRAFPSSDSEDGDCGSEDGDYEAVAHGRVRLVFPSALLERPGVFTVEPVEADGLVTRGDMFHAVAAITQRLLDERDPHGLRVPAGTRLDDLGLVKLYRSAPAQPFTVVLGRRAFSPMSAARMRANQVRSGLRARRAARADGGIVRARWVAA